jgi:glutamate carboxypeptidase
LRPNVVPDLASAEIDVRFRTLADGRALDASVRALAPDDPRVRLSLEGGLHYPPLERTPEVARVYGAAREVAREMGLDLAEVATGGASEVSFAGALGLPALDGLGPDGDGAHSLDEHVLLSSLPTRAALTAGLLLKLTQDERSSRTPPR